MRIDDDGGWLAPAPVPPGVHVVGGAGGTRATLEDLTRAATTLDRAADALESAAEHARELDRLVEQGAPWSPLTAMAAHGSLAPLLSPPRGLRARAVQARDTADSLRRAAELYASTEADVTGLLRAQGAAIAVGAGLGELGPLAWLPAAWLGISMTGQVAGVVLTARVLRHGPGPVGLLLRTLGDERLRADRGPLGVIAGAVGGPGLVPESFGWPHGSTVEALSPGAAAFLVGALPGRAPVTPEPVPQAAGVLGAGTLGLTRILGTPMTGVVVAPVVTAPPRAGVPGPVAPSAPRTAADVLTQVHRLYPDVGGGPAGAVGVQRLDHRDGRRSWVVTVPGTQTWSPVRGPNPADLSTNLDRVADHPDDMTEVVTRAMTMAGVEPGEPVLLAGHSQGGMVAMEVASAPGLREQFSVEMVLTAGSPVGGADLPDGVHALHLEHVQDAVPALEGVPNPDTPTRTTVHVDLAASSSVEDRLAGSNPLTAHGADVYARTAAALAGTGHPSLAGAETALAGVLGDGTATVTAGVYVGARCRGPEKTCP